MRKRRKRNSARRTTRRRRRNSVLSASPRRRRRRNTRTRYSHAAPRRRRRNSTRVVVRRNRRRRNQMAFGGPQIKAVFGGLLGVTATKLIPTALPPNLTGTPIMASVTSVATAWGVGELVKRMMDRSLGEAVQFGGYMQAGSVILNAFIPAIGGQIALRGMRGLGELMAGAYPVPQNPLNPMQANYPAYGRPVVAADGTYGNGAAVAMNGLNRSFGRAF